MKTLLYSILLTIAIGCFGQTNLEKGKSYFDKRAENAQDLTAKKKYINKCIKILKKEINDPEAITLLLRAYEFKGSFTQLSDKKKKELFKIAVDLGSEKVKDYPNHPGILFYYSANLGRWGQEISILKAHKEGITDDLREMLEKVDQLDQDFAEAGAKRLLGGMHLKIPKVPFVMTWPSEEKALVLLENAYETSRDNPANAKLYAEALIENNYKEEGIALLKQVASKTPRSHKYLEDKRVILEAKKILQKET